jgi:hypothetical protein
MGITIAMIKPRCVSPAVPPKLQDKVIRRPDRAYGIYDSRTIRRFPGCVPLKSEDLFVRHSLNPPSMIIPESSVLLQINPFLLAVRTIIVGSSSFDVELQKIGIGRVRDSFH